MVRSKANVVNHSLLKGWGSPATGDVIGGACSSIHSLTRLYFQGTPLVSCSVYHTADLEEFCTKLNGSILMLVYYIYLKRLV